MAGEEFKGLDTKTCGVEKGLMESRLWGDVTEDENKSVALTLFEKEMRTGRIRGTTRKVNFVLFINIITTSGVIVEFFKYSACLNYVVRNYHNTVKHKNNCLLNLTCTTIIVLDYYYLNLARIVVLLLVVRAYVKHEINSSGVARVILL